MPSLDSQEQGYIMMEGQGSGPRPEHGVGAEDRVAARIFDALPEDPFGDEPAAEATGAEEEPKEAPQPAESEDDFDAEAAEALKGEDSERSEEDDSDEGDGAAEDDEDDTEDEDEESEDEPEDEGEPTYSVKVDGEYVELTLDELKAGFSRTESWTRKSQALANERKTFESERAEVTAKRTEYAGKLSALEQHLAATAPKEPEGDDPVEWVKYQKAQKELAAVQAEQTRVYEEHMQAQNAHLERVVQEETELLREAIPEWKDEAAMTAGLKSLFTYATEGLGFDEEDVRNTTNHKLLHLLWKAKAFDEMSGAKETVAKKTKKAKTLKPGTRQSAKSQARGKKKSTVRKGREALRKTGTVKDAAGLFLDSGFVDDL